MSADAYRRIYHHGDFSVWLDPDCESGYWIEFSEEYPCDERAIRDLIMFLNRWKTTNTSVNRSE